MTLGIHGASCITETECIYCPSVHDVTPVDPTAAGDSFIGAFCTAHSIGYSDYNAMQIANHTAAITVCGMGAQPSLPALTDVLYSAETGGAGCCALAGHAACSALRALHCVKKDGV